MSIAPTNIMDMDRAGLADYFAGLGEQGFRANQVLQWVYQRGVTDFTEMTDLSKDLRQRLCDFAEIQIPEIKLDQLSVDGTRKWLLRLDDGNCIETVFIPEDTRGTLCVSSQVGCALNCTFCTTARQGYNRNLTTAEIIGQVWLADRLLKEQLNNESSARPITNIVMMGMGEPLLNYDNVVAAMRLMLDDFSFGLSKRRVTLSTAGVVPQIDRLAKDCPVSLAVSLHAPDDALRDNLVPLNKKYPIDVLLAACRRYLSADTANRSRRKVTFEYTMLAGVNDSEKQAKMLATLLAEVPAKVNLIPFNPGNGIPYQCSSQRTIDRFRDILLAKGVTTITRKTRGDDIDAACGQLAGQFIDRTRRSEKLACAN